MNMPIICFDIDGTLLDDRGNIHPNDVSLLTAPRPPALFIPTTGRPLESIRRTFAKNKVYAGEQIPLPMVLQNGSLLFAGNEVLLAYYPFEPALQKELISLSMRFKDVTFLFLSASDIYVLWPNPFGMKSANRFEFTTRNLSDCDGNCQMSKIMCISESRPVLNTLARSVNAFPVESAFSLSTVLEITPKNVNKGMGLTKLLEALHEEDQPIYAAGDGENDLPLFQLAKQSFALTHALENIRTMASQVIDVSREGLLSPILKSAAG